MRQHSLQRIFEPRSIAVVGATNRKNSVGYQVLHNIIEAGFEGPVFPVNRNHSELLGKACYASIAEVADTIDLVVMAIPAQRIPGVMAQCVASQVGGVVIISAGFGEVGPLGKQLQDEIVALARGAEIPLVGPNCLGVIRPKIGLNATFARSAVRAGQVALVSQSGAFCTALLDAAYSGGRGFSAVASLGATADVGFGEVLDYLSLDTQTQSILLYIEGVVDARAFLSGLRAAARLKPVIVIKPGRHEAGRRAAVTHTGGHCGSDEVFNAALERAGVVRVDTVNQLLAAATSLASGIRVSGSRLAIITNGGGPGVMAADHAVERDLPLAELHSDSIEVLSGVLPPHWSHTDPVDLLGDANSERYEQALRIVLADKNVDGVLVLLTPQGMTDPTACAEGVIAASGESRKPVLACWMGQDQVAEGRRLLSEAGIPSFSSPEGGVNGFGYIAAHRRNQNKLMQAPPPLSEHAQIDVPAARRQLHTVLDDARTVLAGIEIQAVMAAFRFPVERVELELHAPEIVVSIDRDTVFGPVIRCGRGGATLDVYADSKVALPPLNVFLCEELLHRSHADRSLPGFHHLSEADIDGLVEILMRLSEMACELPEIEQLVVNLRLVDEQGVVAVDASIAVSEPLRRGAPYAHMAIHPYPPGLASTITARDGARFTVRPIRPEDAEIEQQFVDGLSAESRYFRFMYGMGDISRAMLARFTQIDYDREMALIVVADDAAPQASMKAVARYVAKPGGDSCEFALAVADDMQKQGLGGQLMERLMKLAKERGYKEMTGDVLSQNNKMLRLCRRLGFELKRHPQDAEVMLVRRCLTG